MKGSRPQNPEIGRENVPRCPIRTTLIFVGPSAILAILLVAVFGHEPNQTRLPIEAILKLVFYFTPVVFVYTFVLLHIHKRKYSVDFWMTELLLAVIPLVILGAYFVWGLLPMDLDRAV